MVTTSGKILDVSTKKPIIGATVEQLDKPANAQGVDSNGAFTITVDSPDTVISAEANGYGQSVGNVAMFTGNVYLYKIDAPLTDKANAVLQNQSKMLAGSILTAVIIVLLLKLFKIK